MLDEEQCRRYIIVFGPPCPCESDHEPMTQESALADELRLAAQRGAGEYDAYGAMAEHLLKHFTLALKEPAG